MKSFQKVKPAFAFIICFDFCLNKYRSNNMDNWKTNHLAETYLEGVRGAIPFANAQIELMMRIINFFRPGMNSFLDLGCGDGVLGSVIFNSWPESRGIFMDYSEPMIGAAKMKCRAYRQKAKFIVQDFGAENWITSLADNFPVDVVVSGFSIHHQDDENKQRIYRQIFDKLLKPGGLFLNLEQVKSPTREIENLFNEFFLDKMRDFKKQNETKISFEVIEEEFYKDKNVNILASVEEQCRWLKKIGFEQVDCYFKALELSIFGGIKPETNA